jgi:hypothetical protein
VHDDHGITLDTRRAGRQLGELPRGELGRLGISLQLLAEIGRSPRAWIRARRSLSIGRAVRLDYTIIRLTAAYSATATQRWGAEAKDTAFVVEGDVVIVDKNSAGRPDQQGEPWFDPYDKWLGIPAKEQPPNHYRLLGVSIFEANLELIDAAANRQVTYLESCATGMRVLLAQRLLDDIAAARLCLLNAAKKAAYDSALERSQQKRPKPNPVRPVDKPGPLPSLSNVAPRGNSRMIGVLVGAALVVAGVTGGILLIGRN